MSYQTRVSPLKVQTISLALSHAASLTYCPCCRQSKVQFHYKNQDVLQILKWHYSGSRASKVEVLGAEQGGRNSKYCSCFTLGSLCWQRQPRRHPFMGSHATELSVSKVWRSGPDALETILSPVPNLLPENIPESCISEMKAADGKATYDLLNISEPASVSSITDCGHYSSLHKLYRIAAHVLKFINILRKRATSPDLTVQDICCSER